MIGRQEMIYWGVIADYYRLIYSLCALNWLLWRKTNGKFDSNCAGGFIFY